MNHTDIAFLNCPLPDCREPLRLTWTASYAFLPSDVIGGPALAIDGADVATWQVGCDAGHVLLLPGDIGCPCRDDEAPECPHQADDYDWSEDRREFRPHDRERLRLTLEGWAAES